jgi:hypothetical protein
MIDFSRGGMIGRIGPFIWFNGADVHKDDYTNTLETGGFNRFGTVYPAFPGERATEWILQFFHLNP